MAPVESRAYLVPQVHWASKACRVSQASQESPEFRFVAFPFSCVVDVGLMLGLDHVFCELSVIWGEVLGMSGLLVHCSTC